jgi:hypothetical protein
VTNEVFANSPVPGAPEPVTQLAANGGQITAEATTFNVSPALPDALQSGGQFHALIDHELVIIPCQAGTTLTGIQRGVEISTQATHLDGAGIIPLLTAGALQNALAGIQAADEAYASGLTTAEATRAEAAESTNAGAISTETSRAETAEAGKASTSALTSETTRAEGAESTNAGAISAEVTRAEGAEGTNATAISTETSRAETAEAAKASTTSLSAETTRAEAAEATDLAAAQASLQKSGTLTNGHLLSTDGTHATDSGLPTQSVGSVSYDYEVYGLGGVYYANPKIGSGLTAYSNADAYTVIQAAITALTASGGGQGSAGGKIHLSRWGAPYNLTNELTIIGWEGTSFAPFSQLTIEGDGAASYIEQTTTGKNALVVKNGACVRLANLHLYAGPNAKSCLLGDDSGSTTEISMAKSEIDGVICQSDSTGYAAVLLKNIWNLSAPTLRADATANDGVCIENTSTTTNYGNSSFGFLGAGGSSSTGFAGLRVTGTQNNHFPNLISIEHLECSYSYYGVYSNCWWYSRIGFVDAENCAYPIYFTGASSNFAFQTRSVKIEGGLLAGTGSNAAITCDTYTGGNTFKVALDSSNPACADTAGNDVNSYEFTGAAAANTYSVSNVATPITLRYSSGAVYSSSPAALNENSGGTFGQAISSGQVVDLCRAPYGAAPATDLTVTLNSTTTATVTAGTAPASGAIIAPGIPANTTFTASGNTLTLSNAATATGSGVTAYAGVDCGSALQTAIDTASVANGGVDVIFSLPGVYLLNGTQQTGTAYTYSYSGQVLFPAFPYATEAMPVIRIRGMVPAGLGETDIAGGGVFLYSSAASGNVFDVIPGGEVNSDPLSGITVLLEDLRIIVPTNPQCGGAKLYAANAAHVKRFAACAWSVVQNVSTLTGSGVALTMPGVSSGGQSIEGVWLDGFPVALIPADHCVMYGDNQIWHCKDGVHLNGAENPVEMMIYIGGTENGVVGNAATIVRGKVGWELAGGLGFSGVLISDPNDYLSGDLHVYFNYADISTVPACVFGRNPALNLRRINDGRDWMSRHPSETFTRDATAATTGSTVPGITDGTLTPWWVQSGTWTIATSGQLKALGSGNIYVPAKDGGVSRLINVTLTPVSSSNFLVCGAVAEDSLTCVSLQCFGQAITMYAAGSNVGSVSSAYTNGTSITVGLALYYGPNANGAGQRCYRAKALVNGAVIIDKYLPTADQPAPSTSYPFVYDGLQSSSDTTTIVTAFKVTELQDDDSQLTPQHAVSGTTAGTATWEQPFQGPTYKKVLVSLAGYENTTATAQTITFTTPFTVAPRIVSDDSGGASVSTTVLTLPASMGSTKTGWIILEGY